VRDLKSIKDWQKLVHNNAVNKGFWDSEEDFKKIEQGEEAQFSGFLITKEQFIRYMVIGNQVEKLALIHSEVSEALEALRSGNPPSDKIPQHSSLSEELSDAIIRIFDLAGKLGLNLEKAINDKHDFNTGRPHKHGREL
jgi:NTP pyrophosphatase (non-canonical NTP hydrolase)